MEEEEKIDGMLIAIMAEQKSIKIEEEKKDRMIMQYKVLQSVSRVTKVLHDTNLRWWSKNSIE